MTAVVIETLAKRLQPITLRLMSGSCRFSALLFLACAAASAQPAASKYIVADLVADMVQNGQVIGRLDMGQVVSIQALAENGSWGLVTVGGVSGWVSSKNLVPARPLSIAYFQGTRHFHAGRQALQQGGKEVAQKEFGAAIPLLRNAVDLAKKENNPRYLASASTNLAISYDEIQQFAKAEPHYLQSYRINESLPGAGHERLGVDARNLGFFYQRWKKSKEALLWHQRALAIFEAKYGGSHVETAKSRLEAGALLSELGQLQEAAELLTQAHSILQASAGAGDAQTQKAALALAQVDASLGKMRKAEELYRQVLAARETALGPEDLSLAGVCQLLANVRQTLGKTDEVEGLLQRSLHIRELRLGADHPNLIVSLRDLADRATVSGRYAEAEQHLERAMGIALKQSKNAAEVANVQEGQANLRKQQGRYEQAEELYRSSLATLEKAGQGDDSIAHTLRGWSHLLMLTERHEEAMPVLERRLRLLEGMHGKAALQLVDTIEDLGTIHRLRGRLAEAEKCERRALEIVQRYPESRAYEAACWNNLGAIFATQQKHETAQDAYRRGLDLLRQVLQEKNHRIAYVRINLALQEQALGRHAEARQQAREARELLEQCAGDFDRAISLALSIEADTAHAEGRIDQALEAAQKFRRLTRQRVDKLLLVRSASERLQFLQEQYARDFQTQVSWALDAPQQQAVFDATAEWMINGKNIAGELEANVAKLSRHAESQRIAAAMSELETVRRQMAEITWREDAPRTAAELARLAAEETRLTREIRSMGTPENVGGQWIELDAVRRMLPQQSCLIEMMRLRRPEGGDGYGAWLIPPAGQGAVTFVNLGSADAIETAVKALLQEINRYLEQGAAETEAAAEQRFRAAASAVARLVSDPLLPHLQGMERCFIAPDAALWLVPWGTLPTDAHEYLVEKLEICQVASGRDLARPRASTRGGNAPLIIADPDFDLSPKAARQSLEKLRGAAASSTRSATRAALPALAKVERLPGTAAEAQAIAPALASYAGTPATLLMGAQALEGAVKTIHRPSVAMLSTHGFYFPAASKAEASAAPAMDASFSNGKSAAASDNPLLRCGLLLAGCNIRDKASSSSAALDDGILSGLEILGLDLEGCELVVLSACETGLGTTEAGEGVAGLRQAFQLAGAGGVMDTLWSIPDEETTQLMQRFFQALSQQQSPAAALRDAQRHIITTRRAKTGAAHPFFWGAFGFTGR